MSMLLLQKKSFWSKNIQAGIDALLIRTVVNSLNNERRYGTALITKKNEGNFGMATEGQQSNVL